MLHSIHTSPGSYKLPLFQDLEDCFDETGLDDIFFTLHEEVDDLTSEASAEKVLATENSGILGVHAAGSSFNRFGWCHEGGNNLTEAG